jgi:hypothetical protein
MEVDLKKHSATKTIKIKNNNVFENGRQPHFFVKEDNLKKIMQPKTIKSKNNGCGIALGNLVRPEKSYKIPRTIF